MSEIQTANWDEAAASNNAATPDGWPEGQAPSTANNCAREMMAALKREWNRTHPTINQAGTAAAYTLTYTTAPASLASGLVFCFRAATSCSANVTLNVNALGAKQIQKMVGASLANLAANDILAGHMVLVAYHSTPDAFVLLSGN